MSKAGEIQVINDPLNGQLLLCEGVVDGVYFNELKNIKTYTDSGKSWTPTHSLNIVVSGQRIGLGLTDKDYIQGRDKSMSAEGYVPVTKGAKVVCIVTEDGVYKGVKQYASKSSKIVVKEPGEAKSSSNNSTGSAAATPREPFDASGMEAGHAINAAYRLLSYKQKDNAEVLEFAKKLHVITMETQKAYKELHPEMTKQALGASVGHAILNACTMTTKSKVDDVQATALAILQEISNPTLAFVKGEDKQEERAPEVSVVEQDDLGDDLPF